jgi:4-amino-4-deoxy-L-arabinose transferase-like glycosyltransferase
LPIVAITLLALFLRLYRLQSVPPGINGDELFNAIDALRLGWGKWQIYFEGNNGREALFLYLMAIPLNLFGHQLWALRLPAVLLGVGSVFTAYGIGRQQFNRRVGLIAALLLAVSLWPMMQARWGLRAVSLTFLTGLTVYLYGRAFQNKTKLTGWLLAGLVFGLTQYTYLPARIFPIILLGWFAWLALTNWRKIRTSWRQMLFSFLIALLVFAPYAVYMVRNPEKVNQRIGALDEPLDALRDGDLTVLTDSVSTAVRIFSIEGDPAGRYHTSTRPLFDPITTIFLFIGLITTGIGAFRRGKPDHRAINVLLLLWMGIMVLPGAVAGLDTASLRSAGAVVPAYLITALGIERVYIWLLEKRPNFQLQLRYGLVGLLIGGGLLTFITTWHTYFDVWVHDPEVRAAYQVELAEVGRYLNQNPPPDNTRVYIGYNFVTDSAPQTFTYYSDQPVTWFDNAASLAWDEDGPAWYFITNSKPLAPETLGQLSDLAGPETISFSNGDPAFTIYRTAGEIVDSQPRNTAEIAFINGPKLLGFDIPETIFRGETIPVLLHFEIPASQQPLTNELTNAQVFLEDAAGNLWGQAERLLGYPQASWQAEDQFIQVVHLEIPQGLPPGPIYLRFGLRDWQGQPYEAVASGLEKNGPFLVRSRPLTEIALEPDTPVFDGVLALQEHVFSTLVVPGLPVNISLSWLAVKAPQEDYRVQLELIESEADTPLVSQIFEIWPGVYPTSQWQKGEQVTSLHQLRIPLDISAESTPQLHIQLLPPEGEIPLPLTQGDTFLADLMLQIRDYLFDPPPIATELDAQFGENIRLLGYDLDTAEAHPNGQINLTLYWQAINTPTDGYTVFNHLVGPDGQTHGQFDSPPVNDAWLTQTWLPGEIIIDRRVIPVNPDAPPGSYEINIGLYTAFDLIRLPVWLNGQPQPGDQLLLTNMQIFP